MSAVESSSRMASRPTDITDPHLLHMVSFVSGSNTQVLTGPQIGHDSTFASAPCLGAMFDTPRTYLSGLLFFAAMSTIPFQV